MTKINIHNRKNKVKGFTLIELLAVIVILAIIAFIATPMTLKIIELARTKAAEASAAGYFKALEYSLSSSQLEEISSTYFDGVHDAVVNEFNMAYKGTRPTKGFVEIEKGKLIYSELCIDNYPIKYKDDKIMHAPNDFSCSENIVFVEPEGIYAHEIYADMNKYETTTNIKIKTIEDIIAVSKISSEHKKDFKSKNVLLVADLDFNKKNDYINPNDTSFGDVNGNGITEGIQTELTTEKGFMPISQSLSYSFKGVFEGYSFTLSNLMINRPDTNYVGLIGYNVGTVKALNLNNISVIGNQYTGGVAGYNTATVTDVKINGNVEGTSYVGGIAGYGYGSITNVISNTNVTGTTSVAGLLGNSNSGTLTGVIEGGTITSTNSSTSIARTCYCASYCPSIKVYVSDKVVLSNSGKNNGTTYTEKENLLLAFDGALDTWINGDNDSSGYYFDYDSNNNIVLRSTEMYPITFNLKGEGTAESPYLISNYQDWIEATTKTSQLDVHFKLTADIDFKNKNFYPMGTGYTNQYFTGTFDGDNHKLLNIKYNGIDYAGIFIYNNDGTIKNLIVENADISSQLNYAGIITSYNNGLIENIIINNSSIANNSNYTGGITGYNIRTIKALNLNNISVTGKEHTGGVAGYNTATVTDIKINGNVEGTSYVGGIVGAGYSVVTNIISNTNVTGTTSVAGLLGNSTSGTLTGVIEGGTITSTNSSTSIGRTCYCTSYCPTTKAYVSDKVVLSNSGVNNGTTYTENENLLLAFDGALDTWINGDNDSSGYYFDYDSNNNIVLRSTEMYPITFNLKGEGTAESPYLISNYQDWTEATTKVSQLDVHFKLTADIDFKNKNFYPMGSGDINQYFTGTFDGNNHKLLNIKYNGIKYTGIFPYNNGGTIKNLIVENADISSQLDYAGIITSYNKNNGLIENIIINNSSIINYSNYTGGIAGYNTATIKALNLNNISVTGKEYTGGVAGYNTATVTDVKINGNVEGTSCVGGIAGYGYGSITNVISNTNVTGTTSVAGLLGNSNSGTLTGVIEGGTITSTTSSKNIGRTCYCTSYCPTTKAYVSDKVVLSNSGVNNGTTYTLTPPNIVGDIDSLSYYENIGILDTYINGDDDSSGYYFKYDQTGTNIIIVPAE